MAIWGAEPRLASGVSDSGACLFGGIFTRDLRGNRVFRGVEKLREVMFMFGAKHLKAEPRCDLRSCRAKTPPAPIGYCECNATAAWEGFLNCDEQNADGIHQSVSLSYKIHNFEKTNQPSEDIF